MKQKKEIDFGKAIIEDGVVFDEEELLNIRSLHKYIVAFYLEAENEDSWCGSGVIIGNHLITVAHVMIDKHSKSFFSKIYYKYEKIFHMVTNNDIVYDGRDGLNDDTDNIHHDLLVFKLPDNSKSFVLNADDFEVPVEVFAKSDGGYKYGYSFIKCKIIRKEGVHYKDYNPLNGELTKWENCLLTTGCFSEGNSGTPIYLQNTVYGLLIGNTCLPDYPDKVFYNFIDARYIEKIIAETANT